MPTHDERLRPPWAWMLIALGFVVLGTLEIGSGFTYVVLIPVAIFLVGFFVVPLVVNGRVRVRLQDGVLTAGKQSIPVTQLTSVTPLDRAETRLQLGPRADPAAYTMVRGWIGPSVMLRLANPQPVPYWLVSTRHPDELAAAIKASRNQVRAAR